MLVRKSLNLKIFKSIQDQIERTIITNCGKCEICGKTDYLMVHHIKSINHVKRTCQDCHKAIVQQEKIAWNEMRQPINSKQKELEFEMKRKQWDSVYNQEKKEPEKNGSGWPKKRRRDTPGAGSPFDYP
jgi:hypothetical protein